MLNGLSGAATITDSSGSDTIAAPVALGSDLAVSVAAGSAAYD